jgi:hypothetical protein
MLVERFESLRRLLFCCCFPKYASMDVKYVSLVPYVPLIRRLPQTLLG